MVSVIIPTYNREKSVLAAVNSVLRQTYKDLELIVVDDGSKDRTKDILSRIQDTRFHYVYQKNAGACVARNHGIELAKGDFIAFHDSDDIWLEDKLAKQMHIFENNDVDLVFCKLNYTNANGVTVLQPDYIKEGLVSPVINLFGIGTQTIIGKSSIFKRLRFDEKLPRFQEFELLYRIAENHTLYCLDEGLVNYSIGVDSISSNPEKLYITCKLILDKHPEMKTKYPVMMNYMAHSLLSAANVARKRHMSMKKYILFSRECAKSTKLTIKTALIYLHLYDIRRRIVGK